MLGQKTADEEGDWSVCGTVRRERYGRVHSRHVLRRKDGSLFLHRSGPHGFTRIPGKGGRPGTGRQMLRVPASILAGSRKSMRNIYARAASTALSATALSMPESKSHTTFFTA